MLKGMLDYIRSDNTDAKRSVSGSSQLYIIASTSSHQSVRGSHNMDESSSTSGSYSSVEGPSPHPVQLLAPPFPVNAPAGLCGPVLVGASSYGQLEQVGQGTFGRVIHADVLNGPGPKEVAIKLLPRGRQVQAHANLIRREVLHQSSLQHPCIVSLREVFLTPTHLAMAMEYAPGGDLYQYLLAQHPNHGLPEDQARWFFQQLLVGLDYCHRKGVANRDLKLENLLLINKAGWARPMLKICDFGYSKHELASPAKTYVGTPVYMAPEIILGPKRYDAKKADLWSCGIILYALLYGHHPFNAYSKEYIGKVVRGEYTIPDRPSVSAECVQLLKRLLQTDPSQRISLQQVMELPWFRSELPDGCLTMNDWYCAASKPPLDQYMSKVEEIISRASTLAQPGEECRGMFAVVPGNSHQVQGSPNKVEIVDRIKHTIHSAM